jgi:hypothetical protein
MTPEEKNMYYTRRKGWKPIRDRVKQWEVIADNLSKAGWSWGCVSANQRAWAHNLDC